MDGIRLECGDCLELMMALDDASIDAIVCDLPFGTTQCDWDRPIDLTALWEQYIRTLKPNGVCLLFAAQPFTSQLIASRPDLYRHLWYWAKEKGTNFFRTGRQPLRIVEEVAVFAPTAKYTYNPQMVPLEKPYRHTMPLKHSQITGRGEIAPASQTPTERQYKEYTHRHPTNLLRFPRDKANKSLIPTQKPVALVEYLLRTYTNAGDLVLDNCMGSGTTGVACLNLDRQFIGMEIDPDHFAIAQERLTMHGSKPL